MVFLDGGGWVCSLVVLEILIMAETEGVPTDAFLHIVKVAVYVLVVKLKEILKPRVYLLVLFHHSVVGVSALSVVNSDLSFL